MRQQPTNETASLRTEDKGQPPYLYPDYVVTRLRAPKEPLLILPRTLSDTTGSGMSPRSSWSAGSRLRSARAFRRSPEVGVPVRVCSVATLDLAVECWMGDNLPRRIEKQVDQDRGR